MKNPWKIFFILTLALVLVAIQFATADANPPAQKPIPHPVLGREMCVVCHATGVGGATKFPPDHAGRTNEMCQGCHKLAASPQTGPTATPRPGAGATRVPGTTPTIPHALQNRDNCLACHQAGIGGASRVQSSHAGRTNTTCRTCHQSASANQVPLVVPTPVIFTPPPAPNRDGCVTCHTAQAGKLNEPVKEWQSSAHAERGVGCASCHGGDATKNLKEDAHAVKAGYTGKPNMVDTPALCASCHARAEAMRQYDLPIDQYSKYQQSIHGIRLAQADFKVATCFTCHDGHATKKVNDPTSQVYPLNVPAMCARCHSNTDYMKGYNIPTNQHALYVVSVHGKALLNKQDTRAPSCATCHGTHGAAPPGFEEVENVCGSCHTATQEYYLKSSHSSDVAGTPKCVTCHGRYDVSAPSEDLFVGAENRKCGSCHGANTPPGQAAQEMHTQLTATAKLIEESAKAIEVAEKAALIVAPEKVRLSEAKTNLITARAAQHTLDRALVKEKTEKANAQAKEIIANSEKAIADSVFRRQFMIVGLAIMTLAILSLWIIRRELYKQLPPE